MSTPSSGPFIGALSRLLWQWVRSRIYGAAVTAGFDDLNPAHVALFRYPSPDGSRPGELAEDLHITKQSVNELLGHLEECGYLVRDVDPDDRRGRRVRLTDRGLALQAAIWEAAAAAEREAAAAVGRDRVDDLRSTLLELVEVLGLVNHDERG